MKSLMATLFVVGMFLTTPTLADDVEDVKAAAHRYYDVLNAGDVDAYAQANAAEFSIFAAGGGLKRNYNQPKHSEVKVYGNMVAVETSYTTGSSTSPSGTITRNRNRATRIWIKQGGQWKIVHRRLWAMAVGLVVLTAVVAGLAVWLLVQPSPPEQSLNRFVIRPSPPVFLVSNNSKRWQFHRTEGSLSIWVLGREGANSTCALWMTSWIGRSLGPQILGV